MRTLIQISDLHFGRIDYSLVDPLLSVIHSTRPDLVVVSGDFTQRARKSQFEDARRFLDSIPFPTLVVPGNHDVPLYNLFARFFRPLVNYRRYITPDLSPFFHDAEIAVAGINTARSFTRQYGRINERQIALLTERFRPFQGDITRIVVTHHPFDLPPGYANHRQLVGRAKMAMNAFALSGVDLLLSGHLHLTHTGFTTERYKITGYSALVVQAGTAISTRGRGEANSFNIIRIEQGKIDVERIAWVPEHREFRSAAKGEYVREKEGWLEKAR